MTERTYHMAIHINHFARMSDKDLERLFTFRNGKHPKASIVRAQLEAYRASGTEFWPIAECDNADERGICRGHDKAVS